MHSHGDVLQEKKKRTYGSLLHARQWQHFYENMSIAAVEETLNPVLQEPLAGAAAVNNTGGSLELLWIKQKMSLYAAPSTCTQYCTLKLAPDTYTMLGLGAAESTPEQLTYLELQVDAVQKKIRL